MVIVPVRLAPLVLAATVYPTVAPPPEATVIQATLLTAVNKQNGSGAVTNMLPVPPPASNLAVVGEIEYVHGG
jgi:hypothetical protein